MLKIPPTIFSIFGLFFLYFGLLELAVSNQPINVELSQYTSPARMILEFDKWPIIDILTLYPPNLPLTFAFFGKLFGLNISSLRQGVVLLNILSGALIWFHCWKLKMNGRGTIILLAFSMLNINSYYYFTTLSHNVISNFLLVGGFVFLTNFKDGNKSRYDYLFIAGVFLGFAANCRQQYLFLIFLSFIWLICIERINRQNIIIKKSLFYFILGITVSSLYTIFSFLKSPSSFLQMMLINHTIMGVFEAKTLLDIYRGIFSYWAEPSILIPFIFLITSSFILLDKNEGFIKKFCKEKELQTHCLALGFIVIIYALHIYGPNSSRLVDANNFIIFGMIPFLRRAEEKEDFIKFGSKSLITLTLFFYSTQFFYFNPSRPRPYDYFFNEDQFQKKTDSLHHANKVRDLLKKSIKPGDIIFSDQSAIFLGLPFGFIKGAENEIATIYLWQMIPKELATVNKIIPFKSMINKIKNGEIRFLVLGAVAARKSFEEILQLYEPPIKIGDWYIYKFLNSKNSINPL